MSKNVSIELPQKVERGSGGLTAQILPSSLTVGWILHFYAILFVPHSKSELHFIVPKVLTRAEAQILNWICGIFSELLAWMMHSDDVLIFRALHGCWGAFLNYESCCLFKSTLPDQNKYIHRGFLAMQKGCEWMRWVRAEEPKATFMDPYSLWNYKRTTAAQRRLFLC